MPQLLYRFHFREDVPMEEVEATLWLALVAMESLYGEPQARLQIAYAFDAAQRSCVIDDSTGLGEDLSCVYIGFLQLEFEPEAFRVERLEPVF